MCILSQRILHITVNQYKDELALVFSGNVDATATGVKIVFRGFIL